MTTTSHPEAHGGRSGQHLNRLRAAVLGANDGITSVAGIVVGVAAATNSKPAILTAGVAGLLAGAVSMAAGEYVSVSSQRDTEKALLEKERYELKHYPQAELAELTQIYRNKGLQAGTAEQVAKELTAHDAFAAHSEAELGIDPNELTDPWQAAGASAVAFSVGGMIPLAAVLVPAAGQRLVVTVTAVLVALVLTGLLSARSGGAPAGRAMARILAGGIAAMLITYGIGRLLHLSGITS
jgi:vacuolar iron transporter family protein